MEMCHSINCYPPMWEIQNTQGQGCHNSAAISCLDYGTSSYVGASKPLDSLPSQLQANTVYVTHSGLHKESVHHSMESLLYQANPQFDPPESVFDGEKTVDPMEVTLKMAFLTRLKRLEAVGNKIWS